jgi:hypothetical protein
MRELIRDFFRKEQRTEFDLFWWYILASLFWNADWKYFEITFAIWMVVAYIDNNLKHN